MGQRGAYFLLNTEQDFLRGEGSGIVVDREGVALADGEESGVYLTRVFDSGVSGMSWHRLVLDGDELTGQVSVEIFAAERESELTGEKLRRGLCANARDVLLTAVEGRYLRVAVHLYRRGGGAPRLRRLKVCFPRRSWLSYLPEIYQEEEKSASFLARYLGIFQSLYEDMTERIYQLPASFTPRGNMLDELADWFGIPGRDLWNREQLAWLVENAPRLSRSRGTAGYLKELLWLRIGEEVFVVEYVKLLPYFDGGARERQLKELYASGPYEFALLLNPGGRKEAENYWLVERIVELAKPAHMECRTVTLEPYIFLGRHSYLGVNSVLGRYRALELDQTCAVPFAVLEGGERS